MKPPVVSEGWRLAAETLAWVLSVIWLVRTRTLIRRIGEVPDLADVAWDLCPVRAPGVIVIVPAKDEEKVVGAALQTLLDQDYPWLRIVAVDDRSTDQTGAVLDQLAAAHPERLGVLHLTDPSDGWLGKTFAMEAAAQTSQSEYLLFTEADVWFSPSAVRRAVAFAEFTRAEHVTVLPSPVLKRWGEGLVLSFLQLIALWVVRPWRVADPRARWSAVGFGALNLIRRDAWEELGGFAPQRMSVPDALTLGRRVRAAGMRQWLAIAPGMVLQHWAEGGLGVVRAASRYLYPAVNFRLGMLVALGLLVGLFFLAPLAGLAWWQTLLPCLLTIGCIAVTYREAGEITGIPPRWGWAYPWAAVLFFWIMLRGVLLAAWRRGLVWRGTHYDIGELRGQGSPFRWEWEAARLRAERRKAERIARPSRFLQLANRIRRRQAPAPGGGPGRNASRRTRRE